MSAKKELNVTHKLEILNVTDEISFVNSMLQYDGHNYLKKHGLVYKNKLEEINPFSDLPIISMLKKGAHARAILMHKKGIEMYANTYYGSRDFDNIFKYHVVENPAIVNAENISEYVPVLNSSYTGEFFDINGEYLLHYIPFNRNTYMVEDANYNMPELRNFLKNHPLCFINKDDIVPEYNQFGKEDDYDGTYEYINFCVQVPKEKAHLINSNTGFAELPPEIIDLSQFKK